MGPQLEEEERDGVRTRNKAAEFLSEEEKTSNGTPMSLDTLNVIKHWRASEGKMQTGRLSLGYNLRVEVNVICLHARFVSWSVWIPPVHLKLLYSRLCCGCLGISHCLQRKHEKSKRNLV